MTDLAAALTGTLPAALAAAVQAGRRDPEVAQAAVEARSERWRLREMRRAADDWSVCMEAATRRREKAARWRRDGQVRDADAMEASIGGLEGQARLALLRVAALTPPDLWAHWQAVVQGLEGIVAGEGQ